MPHADRDELAAAHIERRVEALLARRTEPTWTGAEVAMLARVLAHDIREGAHLEPVAVAAGRVA